MGSCDIMQYLARLGIDVNIADADGHTALHHVAHDGRIDMVKFFVEECGAKIDIQNKVRKLLNYYFVCLVIYFLTLSL